MATRPLAFVAHCEVTSARAMRDESRRSLARWAETDPTRLGFGYLAAESVLFRRQGVLEATQRTLRRVAGVVKTYPAPGGSR